MTLNFDYFYVELNLLIVLNVFKIYLTLCTAQQYYIRTQMQKNLLQVTTEKQNMVKIILMSDFDFLITKIFYNDLSNQILFEC